MFFSLLALSYPHSVGHARTQPMQLPRYELAFDGDVTLCNGVLGTFNRLLQAALRHPKKAGLTDFETSKPEAFAAIGLQLPKLLGREYFGGGNRGVVFYSAKADDGRTKSILGVLDWSRGLSTVTNVAVLKPDYRWNEAPGSNAIGPLLPFRRGEVEQTLMDSLVDAQSASGLRGGYYLTSWPNFSVLMQRFRTGNLTTPLPMISGSGPTIRPFEYQGNQLYFIIDGSMPVDQVTGLRVNSPNTSTVVVARLRDNSISDRCYLVLAPSALASTIGARR
jgi:hypothetical protein